MFVNENGKYTSKAQFFYNDHIDMYCIIDTTLSGDLDDLTALFESADLLEEVPMPEYITEDYEGNTW